MKVGPLLQYADRLILLTAEGQSNRELNSDGISSTGSVTAH